MEISPAETYQALSAKGVTHLYHANSVATSCQFLRSKSLLSRGTVERSGLAQTKQSSDEIDKKHGVWFDVFTDSVDIHARAGKRNAYGSVLFVIDLKILLDGRTGGVWVTRSNPTKWNALSGGDRWFQSAQDLDDRFVLGEFDQMIVFRHCGGQFDFEAHLSHLVIDDPGLTDADGINFLSLGMGALRLALQDGGLDVPVKKRQCHSSCKCLSQYAHLHTGGSDGGALKFYDGKI